MRETADGESGGREAPGEVGRQPPPPPYSEKEGMWFQQLLIDRYAKTNPGRSLLTETDPQRRFVTLGPDELPYSFVHGSMQRVLDLSSVRRGQDCYGGAFAPCGFAATNITTASGYGRYLHLYYPVESITIFVDALAQNILLDMDPLQVKVAVESRADAVYDGEYLQIPIRENESGALATPKFRLSRLQSPPGRLPHPRRK